MVRARPYPSILIDVSMRISKSEIGPLQPRTMEMALRRGSFCLLWVISCRMTFDLTMTFGIIQLQQAFDAANLVSEGARACWELLGVPGHPQMSPKLAPAPPFSLRD